MPSVAAAYYRAMPEQHAPGYSSNKLSPLGLPVPSASIPLPTAPVISPAVSGANSAYGLTNTAGLTSSGIPKRAYTAYVAAAKKLAQTDPSCKINWSLIAGIGRVESNHGRYGGSTILANGVVSPPILGVKLDGSRPGTARVSDTDNGRYDGDTVTDRAVGPMQFLPATWKAYGGGANPQNIDAAALAAGKYLCAGGGRLNTQKGRWAAVYRYNHSDSYVSMVLALADAYASGTVKTFPSSPSGSSSSSKGPAATTPGKPPAVPNPSKPKPTPTPTTSPTSSPTKSPTKSPTPSPTTSKPTTSPTTKPTTTPSPTGTPKPTGTPTPTGTTSPTCTPTATPTGTPTPTPTPTATPTPTSTPTPTCPA